MAEPVDERVLVLAPGRDGALTCRILGEAGIGCRAVASVPAFNEEFARGAGAAIIAEEALDQESAPQIAALLKEQPAWSDFPIILVVRESGAGTRLQEFSPLGNVSLFTRPMNLGALTTAIGTALRARRRQYEVRNLLAERDSAARRKDEFLAMLAHELRNPLAPVRTTLHVLKLRHPGDRDTQTAVGVAERSVKHLARLIDDLLDVSRVTLGKVGLRCEHMDAADVVRLATEAMGARFAEKHVALDIEVQSARLPVSGDAVRLEQAIANVLDNALKFTPPGGKVRVRAEADRGEAKVTVSDTGAGIAPEDLPHVFDLFVQADRSLDRTVGGLGVGLTIVKGLVELHGGRIAVTSDGLGAGTTAVLHLPLAEPPPSQIETDNEVEAGGRLRVLVVDDNHDGADSLADFLSLTGCETKTAYDGVEALEVFSGFRPEAVLLDIGLPKLNGFEVAEKIRTSPGGEGVTIIAVTGYGRDEDRVRGRSVGFDHHLVKPIDLTAIGRLITSAVRSPRTE
ncbi:Autoinducer 2 sensor kinase/phosphatase LuxQ [Gemmata obscuriglobus]|nr:Autoinducer 2 sensor kinase/phosphatase LuxQ [Gemmata obscuriglobus]VTS09905.1 histidine kinase : Histidine kinase OS=Lysobacter dokdonensis DS-58 GN=LF41_1565 PE=4 SV=1: HisKA: HATPase_c: Response_reg [Gemmata obscuriglobus UQM 2246]